MQAGSVATNDRSLSEGWHHLAGVRRGAATTLFVDGVAVAMGEARLPAAIGAGERVPLVLGGGPRAGFEGELADVSVWDRALEAGEISALVA